MRKLKLLVSMAVVATAFAVAPSLARADAVALSPTCALASDSSQARDCTTWHNVPLVVDWHLPSDATDVNGCNPGPFGEPGGHQDCSATVNAGADSATGSVDLLIDQHPPVLGAAPSAPPPNAFGWYTTPVTVTFPWTDALSQINPAQCAQNVGWSTDTPGVTLSSDCADNAGLSGATAHFFLKYDATPPQNVSGQPTTGPDHGGWYNQPITVAFSSPANGGASGLKSCTSAPYAGPDSPAASVLGSCTDGAGNKSADVASAAFSFDETPPTITGTPADRQPDHNGWYTHPVTFNFQGGDATSQIAACSHLTYTGPDDGTATLKGSCTDNAGNVTNKTIQFKYDATPPAKGKLYAIPGNKSLGISWAPPSDGDSFQLTRAPANGSAAPTTVYSGSNHDFVDEGLQNGAKYNYLLTVYDAAGNASAASGISGVPDGSSLRPFLDTEIDHPPLLSWRKVRKAGYYNVQLFRGRAKVLSIWPKKPHLRLGTKWKFNGKRYRLTKGLYRWYVWPGLGAPSKHRYGSMVGSSTFRVTK